MFTDAVQPRAIETTRGHKRPKSAFDMVLTGPCCAMLSLLSLQLDRKHLGPSSPTLLIGLGVGRSELELELGLIQLLVPC